MFQFNKKQFLNIQLYQNVLHQRKYYDIHPGFQRKVFLPNPEKKNCEIPKRKPSAPCVEKSYSKRVNKLNIQMLSKAIYEQVFIEGYKETGNSGILEQCLKELEKHGIRGQDSEIQQDVDFKIPPLKGQNIEEHFEIIGEEQVKPYRDLLLHLLEFIPPRPKSWVMLPGWTRYVPECEPQQVPHPLEEAFIFDVEVCVKAGKSPTLATAVSGKAWYSWVSPSVIEGASKPVTSHQYPITSLIPLESDPEDDGIELTEHQKKPKVVIGHNVSYDRARIKEQYWINKTGTRFVDTMSLHVCVGGLTSYQRAVIKSDKFDEEDELWRECSSLNNLVDVYKLYCGKKLKKETRNIFVEGTIRDVKDNFQEVMQYCSMDVEATHSILEKLFPLFSERFPHPVTLAGMLELSTAYLPINANWTRYIEESEQAYEDLESESKILLARKADQASQLLHEDKYKEDLWMWDQDWTIKNIKLKSATLKNSQAGKKTRASQKSTVENEKKRSSEEEPDPLEEKFRSLWNTKSSLSSIQPLLPGYPNWYRKLCSKPNSTPLWVPGPHLISTSMKITPKLLCLTWEGYPLHHLRELGWGFLVPFTDDVDIERKIPLSKLLAKCPLLVNKDGSSTFDAFNQISNQVQEHLMKKEYYARLKQNKTKGVYKGTGVWCNTEIEDCCWFFKLPHKDGTSYNVGNPLAKDFLNKFSENVLAGDTEGAEQVLEIARKLSYWRNNRDRIMDQMVVWLSEQNLPKTLHNKGYVYGAIIPQVVVCGTLTRRAVEPTWMTASNAHPERVGSELRAMVQAPPGYHIVGADVDSQELWIASVIGDAHRAKVHGATPFGWMTLSGNKAAGTDMHSVTAKAVGISRDHAKVINYARIYGAGQNFAERLLKQFNPTMSEAEARNKALKMFALTKGKKIYHLKSDYLHEFADLHYNKWQAFDVAKVSGKSVNEMFHQSRWIGGSESAMFNRLEDIANSEAPCTPFLNGRLSRALEPRSQVEDRYLPTRINWVVQSGAADFLHLMLVCMRWIMKDKARFCLSFHDEVRYMVPDEYRYQVALALHVTNLLTRSFCSYRLGLRDLPQSVAFFSAVEVDKVLRKDSKQDCVTPSNPHGLSKGYGICNGEELNIHEAIKKAGGQFACWHGSRFDEERKNVKSNKKKARFSRSSTR
ncbi:DNA polymerase gamma, catalytic subunit tam isoform X1 [Leptinotarsa decemlineata]|uniref:DNA polymerase gamma, catalytic subunit tam isoform X1 n=2 Tax=Leptinotarsa decemlineata TaxID=7539 RepID=UPI003D30876F